MNKLNTLTDFVTDAFKIIDEKDFFKDFLNNNDEILSSSSWGSLIKYLGQKAIEIEDLNDAYFFTIYTSYLNTFQKALEFHDIKENNFAVPSRSTMKYDYKQFNIESITKNPLKVQFDTIFKDFTKETNQAKIQKYINNNLKYNYFLVLEQNNSVLQSCLKHTKSDLGIEEQNNFKKNIYKTKIANEYFDVVMGDENGLTLDDLYIEPYFRVHKNCFSSEDKRIKDKNQTKYINVKNESIHKLINDILQNKNNHKLDMKDVNTIFIAGQPGQGKSSFSKRYIHDMINNNTSSDKEIIFIKLRNISDPIELLKDIKSIIKKNIPFEIDSLDNYIVVIDGLDELAMKTGLSLNNIDTICQRLAADDTTMIITTRHGYVNFDSLNDEHILIVELKEFDKSQQLKWLNKYKKTYKDIKLSKQTIDKIHKDKNKYILELINQPILLHMIANMDIDDIANLNKTNLYSQFFDILIKRKWEKDAHPLSKLKGVDQEIYANTLKEMLKELAFYIFNSDFEYIQKQEFEKLQSVKELQALLSNKNNNESLQTDLKGIMVSFYFKEVPKDKNDDNIDDRSEHYAIEFLHKSLMEYMAAQYIYDNIKDEFLDKKQSTGKYIIDDGSQALKILWDLFNKKSISREIINNLVQLINEDNQDIKDELSKRFDNFIPYLVEKDFLYSSDIGDNSPIKKSKNTLMGFWNIFSKLNNITYELKDLNIKQKLFTKLADSLFDLSKLDLFDITIKGKLIFNNNNVNNSKIVIYTQINNNKFKNCEFTTKHVYGSLFSYCEFENVIFNIDFFYDNIFKDCHFINCQQIDFRELKGNQTRFINCTHNGKEI